MGLPGVHKLWQPALSLPCSSSHLPHAAAGGWAPHPPFLQAPREYFVFQPFFNLKCHRVPQTAASGFLQPQESTWPVLWGEEGARPSCSPASFLGKLIFFSFSAGNHVNAPSFLSMCNSPGAANNLGNSGFCQTLTQAHPNTSVASSLCLQIK